MSWNVSKNVSDFIRSASLRSPTQMGEFREELMKGVKERKRRSVKALRSTPQCNVDRT